ncbi:MAG: hypothetical protein QME05_02095, partial [Candidatus Margulisbacteria bacterium]|nr:hypothetical protein [Candidatus Margulisiibacteriota bacterium]
MHKTINVNLPAIFLFLGLFPSVVFGQTLLLSKAVEIGIEKNPEIISAKTKWAAAQAVIPKNYFLPDPELGAEFEDIPEGSADLRQAMKRYYKFSQAVPWPGMLISEGKAAAARADMLMYAC